MSRKIRKRPLKKNQHKFFDKKDNSEEKETSSKHNVTVGL